MFKTTKRTLAVLLAVLMLVFSVPFTSFAEEGESKPETSGTYGAFEWALSDDGVLTISGSGELSGKDSASSIPWDALRGQIKKAMIGSGIETIKGANFFSNCPELTTVVFPTSLTYIGANTFKDVTNMPTVYYCGTEDQWAGVKNNSAALTADVLQYHVEHTFNYTSNGDNTHTAVCAICECKEENLACSGGTATCTEEATCAFCGAKYGEKAAHTESQTWKSDGKYHWKFCEVCSAVIGDKVSHEPGDNGESDGTNHWKVCKVCGYAKISRARHVAKEEYTIDGTQHWKECKDCGYIMVEKEDHDLTGAWSNEGTQHWKVCPVCNQQVSVAAHNESTEWSKSSTKHWKVCTECGMVLGDQENHNPSGTWETNESYHWQVCTVCGYDRVKRAKHTAADAYSADGTQHWKVCKDCGYVMTTPEDHTASDDWTVEGNQHFKLCTVCGNVVGTKEDHKPTENLQSSKTQHWSACSVCGTVLGDKVNHTVPENWTTNDTQHWKECPECGYVLTRKTNHTAKTTLDADDNQHWSSCEECGMDLSERVDHDWDYANAVLKAWAADYNTCTVTVACTGCDKTQDIETTWVGKKITKQPTCQVEGVYEYTATFPNAVIPAQVTTEPIPKTEHDWETGVKFEKQGNTWYAYGTCVNHPLSPIKLAATMEEVTPQTCEAAQTIRYFAVLNGVTYKSDIMTGLAATGHNYQFKGIEWTGLDNPAVAPTAVGNFVCSNDTNHVQTPDAGINLVSSKDPGCVTTGEKVYKATVTFDGSTYEDSQTVTVPATDHSYGDWESNGDGTHTRVCTACAEGTEGHSETANCSGGTATCIAEAVCKDCGTAYGELGDHNYGTWINEVAATCTKQGTLGHYHCNVCGKDFDADHNVLNSLVIEKAAHSFTVMKSDATTHWYKCETCDTINGKVAHSGGAATCLEKAKCSVCNTAYGELGDHAYGTLISEVEPGCETTGSVEHYTCSVCEKSFDADKKELETIVVDALGHDFTGDYNNPADGEHNRACTRCDKYGLNGVVDATEDCFGGTATCTQKAVCDICEAEYGDVDPDNHDWIYEPSEEHLKESADCETPAEYYVYCSRCGENHETDTFFDGEELGHDWGEWEYWDDESHIRFCLNDDEHYQTGDHTIIVYVDSYPDYDYPNLYHCWNVKKCSVCGAVLDRSMEYTVVDPDPCEHVYHIDTIITDATCAKEGECIMVCEKCGDKIHDTLSATGNHVDADNSGKCDTCNTKMTGGSHCKYCGKIHGGAFGWLTKFFHSILAIFVR